MSKIIASAAIRGAHSIYAKTEAKLARAKESFGAEKAIELPNTGYYLPVIYGLTGEKVEKLSDMDRVLAYAKDLLPEAPSEHLWLPYLGPTLDAGIATLLAEECHEALNYLDSDPSPVTDLWLGAADDVIMRAKGVEFVDGSAPGFAAVVGAAPDNATAVKLAREMQEKMLYVFMAGQTNGKSFGAQLAEEGIQLGWDTRLVPFGEEVYSQIYSIGFATRAALVAGRDDQLLLVGSDEVQARDMAERLAAVGRREVIGVLAGGFSAYLDEGLPTSAIQRVRAVDLPDLLSDQPDILVVDVRDHSEYMAFHIPGSVNRPYWAFRDGPGDIPTGRSLAVICAAGKRAGLAASALAREGRGPIIHVDNGGVQTLEGMGIAMERAGN